MFYLYVNDLAKKASIVYENGISAPTPSRVASLNHGGAWKNTIVSAGLSGRGAGLFRTVLHILIKVARTNNGLKGTYILKACSFYQQGQLILVLLRV